ncbi:MAG: hypothetical protein ACI8QF_003412, partial [Limisphaerales bacterium]
MKFSALNRFQLPILSIAAIFAFVSGALAAKVPADVAGVYGGLVVQLGASETSLPIRLSQTGRFIVHTLDAEPAKIEAARKAIGDGGHYGLSSAELIERDGKLPYAE